MGHEVTDEVPEPPRIPKLHEIPVEGPTGIEPWIKRELIKQLQASMRPDLRPVEAAATRGVIERLERELAQDEGWPDEIMYVVSVTQDNPVMHRIREDTKSRTQAWSHETHCGRPLSFIVKNAMLPRKHAEKFAAGCSGCHPFG